MASNRSQRRPQKIAQSVPSSPSLRRPSFDRHNSGRSGLRSAEEQLRDIKEGDTSWQLSSSNSLHPLREPLAGTERRAQNGNRDSASESSKIRVYLHNVRKTDTLPLILLAYEISVAALKKANRLWSTDSIQSRKQLYLPVDECSINPESTSSPKDKSPEINEVRFADQGISNGLKLGDDGEWPPRLKEATSRSESEGDETEEWVTIPGIGATQIISISAHKLSYFPTARRNTMERSTSLPTLESLVLQDKQPRDSMDSVASRSSIGSLVEDGVGKIIRYWHDNQGRKRWAKIGKDLIEL
jgi:LysM repeat protein